MPAAVKALGVCIYPMCPAIRKKGSWLCAPHDAEARTTQRGRVTPVRRKLATGFPFDRQCYLAGLPKPTAEWRFHAIRRWKLDWAFLSEKLAVEVDGGAWTAGRHTRGKGFEADIEKYAEAMCLGWTILRVTPKQIENGQALTWVDRILRGPK